MTLDHESLSRLIKYLSFAFLELTLFAILACSYQGRRKVFPGSIDPPVHNPFRLLFLTFLVTTLLSVLWSLGEVYLMGPPPARNPPFLAVLARLVTRNAPTVILGVAFYFLVWHQQKISFRSVVPQSTFTRRQQVSYGIGVGSLLLVVRGLVFLALPERTELWKANPFIAWALLGGFPPLAFIDIGFTVAFAPIVEEMVYRGYLYPLLRCSMGVGSALWIVVLSWTLGHAATSIHSLIGVAALGLILTLLYERTHSVLSCIVAHCLANLSWILVLCSSLVTASKH